MINPIQIAFTYIIIVLSAVVHEYAHAFAAHALGDDTAQREGRLSLNPFVHMELFGTVIIPLLLLTTSGVFIGWAKPVPYNPFNLRDKRHGSLKVALAGPAANFIIAAILGAVIRFYEPLGIAYPSPLLDAIAGIMTINIFLGLFNLIPVPPLDGSKVLFDLFPRTERQMARIGFIGIFIALFLSFYILSPIMQFLFFIITGHQLADFL